MATIDASGTTLARLIATHELLDKVADVVEGYSEKIAERAGALAVRRMAAPGRVPAFA